MPYFSLAHIFGGNSKKGRIGGVATSEYTTGKHCQDLRSITLRICMLESSKDFYGLLKLWGKKRHLCEAGIYVPQLEKKKSHFVFQKMTLTSERSGLGHCIPESFQTGKTVAFWANRHITQPALPLHWEAAPCLEKYLLISLTKTRATLSGKNDTYQVFKAVGLSGCLWCIHQSSITIYHFMAELQQLLWAQ